MLATLMGQALVDKDMVELDRKSIEVLKAIQQNGGKANTSEIRARTGHKNNIIHYRYDKLEDLGLIETEAGQDDTSSGLPPTIARLTDKGEEELAEGLLSGTELPPDTIDELTGRLDRLESRLDTRDDASQTADPLQELEHRVQVLEDKMDSTWDLLGALRTHIEERDDVDFEAEYFG